MINNCLPDRGFWAAVGVVVLALGLFAWPQITRQMRGAVLEVKNLRVRRRGHRHRCVPDAQPHPPHRANALAPVIVASTISLGIFIVAESALSFLGLGLPQNVVSWGNDLSDAQNTVRSGQHLTSCGCRRRRWP